MPREINEYVFMRDHEPPCSPSTDLSPRHKHKVPMIIPTTVTPKDIKSFPSGRVPNARIATPLLGLVIAVEVCGGTVDVEEVDDGECAEDEEVIETDVTEKDRDVLGLAILQNCCDRFSAVSSSVGQLAVAQEIRDDTNFGLDT
jgi:hypothetical protein